MNHYQLMHKY